MTTRQKADHIAIGVLLALGICMLFGWGNGLIFLCAWVAVGAYRWR